MRLSSVKYNKPFGTHVWNKGRRRTWNRMEKKSFISNNSSWEFRKRRGMKIEFWLLLNSLSRCAGFKNRINSFPHSFWQGPIRLSWKLELSSNFHTCKFELSSSFHDKRIGPRSPCSTIELHYSMNVANDSLHFAPFLSLKSHFFSRPSFQGSPKLLSALLLSLSPEIYPPGRRCNN